MTIFERAEISCDRERYLFGCQRAEWGRLHDDSLKDESKGIKQAGLAWKLDGVIGVIHPRLSCPVNFR